jgi:hypothetical protein
MGEWITYNEDMAKRFRIRCKSDAMHQMNQMRHDVSDAMRDSFGYIYAMHDAMRNPMYTIARRYTDADSIFYFDLISMRMQGIDYQYFRSVLAEEGGGAFFAGCPG